MNTRIGKGRSGWEARTKVPFPEVDQFRGALHGEEKAGQIVLSTSKDSRGLLSTTVSVSWVGDGVESFVIFGDFMIHPLREQARATEKSVGAQHQRALAALETYKAQALEFYRAKAAE